MGLQTAGLGIWVSDYCKVQPHKGQDDAIDAGGHCKVGGREVRQSEAVFDLIVNRINCGS